eukprot:4843443-Lingulodinium_polyedra.AAC.1
MHLCVAFGKGYTKMRSNRQFAAAAACKSHVSRAPCKHQFLVSSWCARGVRSASRCGGRWSFRPDHCA